MKIYTKTGDQGKTGLFSGKRVSKDSSAIEAYGTVDELNAWLGFSSAALEEEADLKKELGLIQQDLHMLCADLSTPVDAKVKIERVGAHQSKRLEDLIDRLETELAPLKNFILAGGSEAASRLHIARTVARRAERRTITHSSKETINAEIIIYLNRLSDLLFVMARAANKRAKVEDIPWNA